MHELEITRSLVNVALDEAKKAGAKKLTLVNVVLGEMSGAVDESVEFYFELMTKDTIAEGAKSTSARYLCRPDAANAGIPSTLRISSGNATNAIHGDRNDIG
jgi:hypothetical protein